MKVRVVIPVVFRVFAFVMLLYALSRFPGCASQLPMGIMTSINYEDLRFQMLILSFATGVFYIMVFFFMWKLGNSLVKKLEESGYGEIKTEFTLEKLESLAFRLLGLYYIFTYLPELAHTFSEYRVARASIDDFWGPQMVHFLSYLIVVLVSFFMLARPENFIAILNKITFRKSDYLPKN